MLINDGDCFLTLFVAAEIRDMSAVVSLKTIELEVDYSYSHLLIGLMPKILWAMLRFSFQLNTLFLKLNR